MSVVVAEASVTSDSVNLPRTVVPFSVTDEREVMSVLAPLLAATKVVRAVAASTAATTLRPNAVIVVVVMAPAAVKYGRRSAAPVIPERAVRLLLSVCALMLVRAVAALVTSDRKSVV